jgi:hypothetical protein
MNQDLPMSWQNWQLKLNFSSRQEREKNSSITFLSKLIQTVSHFEKIGLPLLPTPKSLTFPLISFLTASSLLNPNFPSSEFQLAE